MVHCYGSPSRLIRALSPKVLQRCETQWSGGGERGVSQYLGDFRHPFSWCTLRRVDSGNLSPDANFTETRWKLGCYPLAKILVKARFFLASCYQGRTDILNWENAVKDLAGPSNKSLDFCLSQSIGSPRCQLGTDISVNTTAPPSLRRLCSQQAAWLSRYFYLENR